MAALSMQAATAGSVISKFPTRSIGLSPMTKDGVNLMPGMSYDLLASWEDKINEAGDTFGFNNDYIATVSLNENELLMWVNHEYANPFFVSGYTKGIKTKSQVDKERYNVGGSILHIEKKNGLWEKKINSKFNKRITGETPIPIISDRPIAGKTIAEGTLANCAGGVTPWGTFLSCEENFDNCYGDIKKNGKKTDSDHGWEKYYNNSPYHYGWVVEINPLTGEAKKLTSLGRFAHESATCYKLPDGRVVVYSGDDKSNEYLYKFISDKPGSLEKGELFVADTRRGKWISLDIKKQKKLARRFKDQLDVLMHCREAGEILGATPLDRPEDIEIHPKTGDVYLCLTKNTKKLRLYGKILKITYANNDHSSQSFKAQDFIVGGRETGFCCPDNLVFDRNGNIWFTNDISTEFMNLGPYRKFGNNALFYVPTQGTHAGKVIRVASAPIDAEFTGPCFDPNEDILFLSVQHPGEMTKDFNRPTSDFPKKGDKPRPSVIQIHGPTLTKLIESTL